MLNIYRALNKGNLTYVPRGEGARYFWDHGFTSTSYKPYLEKDIRNFKVDFLCI